MRNSGQKSLMEMCWFWLLGILAGAAGSLAIGIVTGRTSSTTSSTSAAR
jgi:hypothetical protein